jgi:ssDNA-binding Zn-finger/Zn-ribbon topoisomerase 1
LENDRQHNGQKKPKGGKKNKKCGDPLKIRLIYHASCLGESTLNDCHFIFGMTVVGSDGYKIWQL